MLWTPFGIVRAAPATGVLRNRLEGHSYLNVDYAGHVEQRFSRAMK